MKSALRNLLLALALSATAAAADPPNIVFFFTDDQTTSTLGCYGNTAVRTPNIDALAARGTRFENAFVSHSICWVSRTTILSGLTGRSYGTPSNPDVARPDAVAELYSDILRENGYRTGYFGKWHAKMPKGFKREDHFDEFEAIGRNPFYKKQPDGSLRHETELIVDRGIEFVKNAAGGQTVRSEHVVQRLPRGGRRPAAGHRAFRLAAGRRRDVRRCPSIAAPRLGDPAIFDALPPFLKTTINRERYFWRWNTPQKYQTNMRAYYRMVSGIDGAIGRFIRALEEAGLADNTIIVYSADNGYHMGNRGLAGKWSHYDESLRVPLIIADPRVAETAARPGHRRDRTESRPAGDLPRLGRCRAVPDKRYQGRSLRPSSNQGKPDDWRSRDVSRALRRPESHPRLRGPAQRAASSTYGTSITTATSSCTT